MSTTKRNNLLSLGRCTLRARGEKGHTQNELAQTEIDEHHKSYEALFAAKTPYGDKVPFATWTLAGAFNAISCERPGNEEYYAALFRAFVDGAVTGALQAVRDACSENERNTLRFAQKVYRLLQTLPVEQAPAPVPTAVAVTADSLRAPIEALLRELGVTEDFRYTYKATTVVLFQAEALATVSKIVRTNVIAFETARAPKVVVRSDEEKRKDVEIALGKDATVSGVQTAPEHCRINGFDWDLKYRKTHSGQTSVCVVKFYREWPDLETIQRSITSAAENNFAFTWLRLIPALQADVVPKSSAARLHTLHFGEIPYCSEAGGDALEFLSTHRDKVLQTHLSLLEPQIQDKARLKEKYSTEISLPGIPTFSVVSLSRANKNAARS